MPPRKVQMDLIGKAQDRTRTFNRRKKGLKKMAYELSVLCGVDVAVVFAGLGGGAPDTWESGAGVIDRYRKLPADKRAKHTHLNCLNAELGKQKTSLAKQKGPKALASPGAAFLKNARLEELLGSIDAALLATAQRRKALDMPPADGAADGGQPRQAASDAVVPLAFGGDDFDDMDALFDELTWHGVEPHLPNASLIQPAAGVQYINGVEPYPLNASMMQPTAGVQYINQNQHQPQMPPGNGENGHGQFPWNSYQPNNTGCFQFQMTVPSNANAYDGCHNMATFGADKSSCHAVVPVAEYRPSMDIAGNAVCMPPEHSTMGAADNFAGVSAIGLDDRSMDASGDEYDTQCFADYFQCPDAHQPFGFKPLHYLSDVAEGIGYYDLDEAGSCNTGRTDLFAQNHGFSGALQFSSEQSRSDVRHQDSGVQQFWMMEEAAGFN